LKLAVKLDASGKFVECDYDDPEAFGRGRADILVISDDTTWAQVTDHKTQPNIETADTPQMGFYSWVISKIYPFLSEIRSQLHFSRYAKYSEPFVWTKELLAQTEQQIFAKVEVCENRTSWDPTPNDHCQYCPLLASCPVMSQYFEKDERGALYVKSDNLKILGSQHKAVQIAGLLNVLEEVVKVCKNELRDFVKAAGGAVAIPGKTYYFKPDEKINWDAVNKKLRGEAYKIFAEHGVDPKDYMSFNQTASQTIWTINKPELVKALAALFPKKISTEFGGHKD
jgi:hypothetical protein